jgi:hypothetical protein
MTIPLRVLNNIYKRDIHESGNFLISWEMIFTGQTKWLSANIMETRVIDHDSNLSFIFM